MARSSASSSERPARAGFPAAGARVYLDYAGFSPVDPRVVAVMRPFFEGGVGNPNAQHSLGLEARSTLDGARAKVARLFAATPGGVIFTANATEANNLAVKGLAPRTGARHIVTSAIEHVSLIDSCRELEKRGWSVTYVGVDAEGRVDPEAVARAIRDDTALVSVMAANNEYGGVFPVAEIAEGVRRRGALFHTDAVQAAGRIPVDARSWGVDLLSVSAHKMHGPKGAGALVIRRGVALEAHTPGGGQEKRLRGGTENTLAIVGFGAAARLAAGRRGVDAVAIARRRDALERGIGERVPGARAIGAGIERLPNTLAVLFPDALGEALLIRLDLEGVAVSVGSACSSGTLAPSPALLALGLSRDEARSVVRFSLSRDTADAEIERVLEILPGIVADVRAASAPALTGSRGRS